MRRRTARQPPTQVAQRDFLRVDPVQTGKRLRIEHPAASFSASGTWASVGFGRGRATRLALANGGQPPVRRYSTAMHSISRRKFGRGRE